MKCSYFPLPFSITLLEFDVLTVLPNLDGGEEETRNCSPSAQLILCIKQVFYHNRFMGNDVKTIVKSSYVCTNIRHMANTYVKGHMHDMHQT